eukprot:g2031.t1
MGRMRTNVIIVAMVCAVLCVNGVVGQRTKEKGNQRFVIAEKRSRQRRTNDGASLSLIEEEESNTLHKLEADEEAEGLEGVSLARCITAVTAARSKFLEAQVAESEIPLKVKTWCVSVGNGASGEDQEGQFAATAWKEGCEAGYKVLESSEKAFSPADFCSALSSTMNAMAHRTKLFHFGSGETEAAPYSPPIATASCKLQYLKKPRPCCDAHGEKGCHDSVIEECVCGVDSKCCTEGWDLRCTELVEKIRIRDGNTVLRCGRCPREVVGEEAIKRCVDSVMP